MKTTLFCMVLAFTGSAIGADNVMPDAGKKAEQQSCTPCHSLRLIHSQRLSAVAWEKEVNKMIGWGAIVPEPRVLLDYLSQEYSDAKPVPNPQLSAPAGKQAGRAESSVTSH